MYPEADFFALFVDPAFLPEALRGRKITTSFLDRIPGGKRIYRQLLPLYPLAVECLDLSGYDLVISADGAATKGVLTDQHTVHLCYCHSPPRSYWDQYAANRRTMPWFASRGLCSCFAVFAAMGLRRGAADRWLHCEFGICRRPGAQVLPPREHGHLSPGGYEGALVCGEA